MALLGLGLLTSCGSSSHSSTPTTGAYAPLRASKIFKASGNAYIDPDTEHTSSADALSVFRSLGNHHYQLMVSNTSAIGFINTFTWVPPPGVTIKAVTSGTGLCHLSGGAISCRLALRPPTCTCRGDGGTVAVSFIADVGADGNGHTYEVANGFLRIDSETPVPYIIPSSPRQRPSDNADLPVCEKGQSSTAAKPCLQPG
jgi:hypothetical protein